MKSYRLASLILCAALLSSCANSTGNRLRRANNASLGALSSSAATGIATNYNCPTRHNVEPDYDVYLDDSGSYSACTHKTDANQVKLMGRASRDATNNKICVFPAEIVDETHWYVKPDLATGRPLVQCKTLDASEALFTFAGTKYNAVFVAEERNQQQMSDCLQAGHYPSCPAFYSYGRFR